MVLKKNFIPGQKCSKNSHTSVWIFEKDCLQYPVLFCSIGYPVVTLGFGFKGYISYKMRLVSANQKDCKFGKLRVNEKYKEITCVSI